MNFSEQMFRFLEDVHRQRVQQFLQPNQDDEDAVQQEKYDLYNDVIRNRGEQGLVVLTRFNVREFYNIFEICKASIESNAKRGRPCKLNTIDKLLVTLTYVSAGLKYSQMGSMFNIRLPLLQRAIDLTLKSISGVLVENFFNHKVALNNEKQFKYYPLACGAIDTTLVQISKPRSKTEQKLYWSHKHSQCGIKIQALVRPNGICTSFMFGYPGSIHDMKVLEESNWVNTILSYVDELPNHARVTHHYPCLFDKGYTGLNNTYPEAIVTIRKPRNRELSQEENNINNRIESDRIIVENFFGRAKGLFGIIATRFRGDKKNHLKHIIPICMSLTNYHISIHPLRQEEEQREIEN